MTINKIIAITIIGIFMLFAIFIGVTYVPFKPAEYTSKLQDTVHKTEMLVVKTDLLTHKTQHLLDTMKSM